jgi:hypothetical protein
VRQHRGLGWLIADPLIDLGITAIILRIRYG